MPDTKARRSRKHVRPITASIGETVKVPGYHITVTDVVGKQVKMTLTQELATPHIVSDSAVSDQTRNDCGNTPVDAG